MNRYSRIALALGATGILTASAREPTDAADHRALNQTSIAIRDAFARGDIKTIMAYHHPDVEKSFGPASRVVGRAAVEAGAADTSKTFTLRFVENTVESLAVRGDTAIEVTRFVILGVPRKEGLPFTFKGRTQVVYVRYAASPTKWAVFRELIQPAT